MATHTEQTFRIYDPDSTDSTRITAASESEAIARAREWGEKHEMARVRVELDGIVIKTITIEG